MRPTSAAACHLVVKHEGIIGESALLTYLAMAVQGDAHVIDSQDAEYRQAVQEAEENARTTAEIEAAASEHELTIDARRDSVDREFDAILSPSDIAETITIRFHLPGNNTQSRVFYENVTSKSLFAFVRHFVFPSQFTLLLPGFPVVKIEDDDSLVQSVCRDRHFVVYVELDD
jgi:hypothetical protein